MIVKTQKILGIEVTIFPKEYILEEIQKYLNQFSIFNFQFSKRRVKPFVIFTPNPEIITYAQKANKFKEIVNTAQINLPDGSGIVWAIKKLFGLKVEKIAGIDFMLELINLAQNQSLRIGLIGGRGRLAIDTLECLQKTYPKLSGWAMDGPELQIIPPQRDPVSGGTNYKLSRLSGIHDAVISIKSRTASGQISIKEIAERIIKEKTDILFVGFGFPKQEYFISHMSFVISHLLEKRLVIMAVGGAFDYISGRVPRAPLVVRNLGLEWLFRLVREPWRLLRQIKGAEFFWRVLIS